MNKTIVAIYVLSVFLVILTLNFTYKNAITGAVVEEPEIVEIKQLGIYSIEPNFNEQIDYDLNEYEEIIKNAKTLINLCRIDSLPAEQCIGNILESADAYSIWSTDCFTEDKKVFYEFVEDYNNCLQSDEEDKICEFSLDNNLRNRKLTIRLEKSGTRTRIDALRGTEILKPEMIASEGLYLTTDVEKGDPDKIPLRRIQLTIRYDGEGISSVSALVNINRDESTFEQEEISFDIDNNKLSFYKYKDGSIAIIDGENYNSFKATKEIFSPIKRIFNFCVKSEKEVLAYDDEDKKTKFRNVEYKFALHFPETKIKT